MKRKGTLLIEGDVAKLANIGSNTFASTKLGSGKSTLHGVLIDGWRRIMMEHEFASGPILCKATTEPEIGPTQMIVATTTTESGGSLQESSEAVVAQPANAGQELSTLMTKRYSKLFKAWFCELSLYCR